MAENKKQHFVPRFYLENFSFDGGTHTNLIRVVELKSIPGIPVAGQNQGDYFYGHELTVEKALGPIEGESAAVIREIITRAKIAPHGTPEDAILKAFVCFQWTRTQAFSENLDSAFSETLKLAYRGQWQRAGISNEAIDNLEIGRTEGPRESVITGTDFIPFFWDLEPKLVFANGLGEFVTSDDPVVFLNPFYLDRAVGGVAGLSLKGVIILFPISPEYLVILYDREVYRVGAAGQSFVPLGSLTDLVAVNNHQYLHAAKNLYHRSAAADGHIAEFGRVKKLRIEERQVVKEIPIDDGKSILHTYEAPIRYKPPTSFMKVLKSHRGEIEPVERIPDRDPAMSQHFQAYSEAFLKGRVRKGFLGYLAQIAVSSYGVKALDEWVKKRWTG